MVLNSRIDKKVIWVHIKTLRREFLRKNININCKENFIPKEQRLENFEKLSKLIGVKRFDKNDTNITKSEINAAGEMFFFLNSCPSFFVRLYWNAIYGSQSRIAILALDIIKKAHDDYKIKAIRIFAKISQVLGFQHIIYQYNKVNKNLGRNIELNVTDEHFLQKVINHPVHIMNNAGEFSPSSFIPFCSFGHKFIGAKVKDFEKIPVCNIFKPKIFNDLLCYETDLQELKDSNNKDILEEQLEMGLTLVLDYNEDRQINYDVSQEAKESFYHHYNSVSMHLDTISKY